VTRLQCSGLTVQEVLGGASIVVVNVNNVWKMQWLLGVMKVWSQSFPQRQNFVVFAVQGFPKHWVVTGLLLLLLFLQQAVYLEPVGAPSVPGPALGHANHQTLPQTARLARRPVLLVDDAFTVVLAFRDGACVVVRSTEERLKQKKKNLRVTLPFSTKWRYLLVIFFGYYLYMERSKKTALRRKYQNVFLHKFVQRKLRT